MAIDWHGSMRQSFELFEIDAGTWREVRRIGTVTEVKAVRDLDSDTIESASIAVDEEVGEVYVRAYIVAEQDGGRESVPVGTWLVQTPTVSHDGKTSTRTLSAYSPLIELRDDMPPIGWTAQAGSSCVAAAAQAAAAHCRAPVSMPDDGTVLTESWTAEPDDTWLSVVAALLDKAAMRLSVAPDGTIGCEPVRDQASVRPARRYDDGNSSILMPDVTDTTDWYGLPNVYEVVLSRDTGYLRAEAVNDDPSCPLSTVSRGRVVRVRDTEPELPESPTQQDVDAYAERMLREQSAREHSVTFTHGWDGGNVGDGVRLDYDRAGIHRDMVSIRQTVNLSTGVTVDETASWKETI
jgi:hypothetical protein